jgi:hypothetical protein
MGEVERWKFGRGGSNKKKELKSKEFEERGKGRELGRI